ncbi:MAG: division/cell wall cluster transcriptional repressor MraZ [Anaerolineae bacterium]
MFLSQFIYTLDSKGRLTIPSRFRDELTAQIVVTRGLDRCLIVYPIDVWEEISEKVTSLPITNPRGRALRRMFFADAMDAELDKQGRVLIPDRLREYAGLDLSSEVKIVGLGRFIELWDPARWEKQNNTVMEIMSEDPALWESLQI